MVPLSTEVALDVEQVGIKRLLTDTESFPLAKAWHQRLGQWAITGACEVSGLVRYLNLIVLFDRIYLTLGNDCVCKYLVVVLARKYLVFSYELQVFIRDPKLAQIEVLLFVIPLNFDHWPVRLLR
jgi:hypothetical protein